MPHVRRILITVSLLAFVSSIGGCLTYDIREGIKRDEFYRKQKEGGISFAGPYCFPDPHPPVLQKIGFLAGLVFLLFLAFRNPLWGTPAVLLSFANYPLWYFSTQRDLRLAESFHATGIDLYLINASALDLFAAFFTSLLAFTILTLNASALALFIKHRRLP